jgi:exopolysaccharide production protein ExoY
MSKWLDLVNRSSVTPVYEIEDADRSADGEDCPLKWIYRIEPFAAIAALAVLLPFTLIIGIVIVILSRRSPLIRHTRVGRCGATLKMLKFRTMWDGRGPFRILPLIENVGDAAPTNKTGSDPRVVSRFASICRRYSLDEIPQLYHIARGEMSLVGPRPITRQELELHYGRHSNEVLKLRPGITGLWQVLGRSRLSYARRRKLDLLLVRRASPNLYLRILLRTVPKVIGGSDAY